MKATLSWAGFLSQAQKDLKHWLFCMAALQLFRVIFIIVFRGAIGAQAGAGDYLLCLASGARFDAKVATIWILIPFLCGVACGFFDIAAIADRVRYAFAVVFTALSAVVFRVAIGYYEEYQNVFDHWIFGMLYDDAGAVMSTVWAQYNLPLNILLAVAITVGLALLLRRFLREPFAAEERLGPLFEPLWRRIVLGVAVAVCIVGGARGSLGIFPLQVQNVAPTGDTFLNKAVLNPYVAFQHAVSEHRQLSHSRGLDYFLPDGDILAAARRAFATDETHADLDRYMHRRAAGPKAAPPRHIFIVVMESYDAWPLLEKYASLRLSEQVARLGREGLLLMRFLPASTGTMTSLAAIVTGLPDAGVYTNYRPTSRAPYPSSIAPIFRRLGYRTRLFYAGYLSWQRIGDFFDDQGFEETFGGGHMGLWTTRSEWGVHDDVLFRFIEEHVDDGQPSLNVVLSTGNHPPYDLDVHAEGYAVRAVPEELRPFFDGRTSLHVLGHLWYADRCLGEFIDRMEQKLPGALFAATGDHFSRKFINGRPDFYERNAVPLLLHGRETIRGLHLAAGATGSHVDILATLIELAAPAGFEYHAFGRDLLGPSARGIAFGRRVAMTPTHGVSFIPALAVEPLPWTGEGAEEPDLERISRLHRAYHGVAWWRIMRGPELPPGRDGVAR